MSGELRINGDLVGPTRWVVESWELRPVAPPIDVESTITREVREMSDYGGLDRRDLDRWLTTEPELGDDGPDQEAMWDAFYAEVWARIGERVALVVEHAGVEVEYAGRISCHADGDYSIGQERLRPGTEGILVRWTTLSSVGDVDSVSVRERPPVDDGVSLDEVEAYIVAVRDGELVPRPRGEIRFYNPFQSRPYDWQVDGECVP